jgi:8-oxo-dGTP diphosphatase
VAVDFLRPRPTDAGGMRFLFDCGVFEDDELAAIALQEEELSEHRLAVAAEALDVLSGPLRRRVGAALVAGPGECVYLEDGLVV